MLNNLIIWLSESGCCILGEAVGCRGHHPTISPVLSLTAPAGPTGSETEMALRVLSSLALLTLSDCDLDPQAGAAAIADLEGETNTTITVIIFVSLYFRG